MSEAREARTGELDAVLDGQPPSVTLAEELFAIADALAAQPTLRRALSDPGTDDRARGSVVEAVFGGKVSTPAVHVLREAARLRWGTAGGLIAAVERQGVRALLRSAEAEGRLDDVEDELFRLGRIVDADRALRGTIADRSAPVTARQELIAGLVAGKVAPETEALARRAVLARDRTFDLTTEGYLRLAAALRQRAVAVVRAARPLTAEQEERLRAVLTRQLGRQVTLQVVVDPAVMGGVRVTVGDEVIEGTVAAKLTEAQRALS